MTTQPTIDNAALSSEHQSPLWLSNFVNIYQKLSTNNLYLLKQLYHQDVAFIDPMHQINGIDALGNYFNNLYENLISCEFEIQNVLHEQEQAAIYWKMSYRHPKLNQSKVIVVEGHSHIKGSGSKVFYHRDYVDIGNMLYEHIPLLGRLIKWLKARATP